MVEGDHVGRVPPTEVKSWQGLMVEVDQLGRVPPTEVKG